MANADYETDVSQIDTNHNANKDEIKFSEEYTKSKSGVKMYRWCLEPPNIMPRALLFITHGYAEHSRRYDKLARLFCSKLECLVFSHDHIGHGRSGGDRVMVESFDVFVEDVFDHIDGVKKAYPNVPVYLFGHSMGGSISILAACKRPEYFHAVLLSSPAIMLDPDLAPGAVKICMINVLNRLCPGLEVAPPVDPNAISSDPDKVKKYVDDPLIWHGGMKLRFAKNFSDAVSTIQELIPSIEWPFLVVHGDSDKLVYPGGSQLLEKQAKSKDKGIKIYQGLRHEMLNEVKERAEQVESDIVQWFKTRMVKQ